MLRSWGVRSIPHVKGVHAMRIEERNGHRGEFMDLLLLADPSAEMVQQYLDRGRLFVLWEGD